MNDRTEQPTFTQILFRVEKELKEMKAKLFYLSMTVIFVAVAVIASLENFLN